ncbi:hypothetical protein Tco_0258183, partial [Tanacetum coccineum]
QISDLELAVYVIDNAVALRKIVIDPVCAASRGNLTAEDFLKREQAAQCSAERQLRPILPRDNAVALRKIVIDPVCAASRGNLTAEDFLKREQAA